MRRARSRWVFLLPLGVVALAGGLVACGGDDSSDDAEVIAPREFSGMAWLATEGAGETSREAFLVAHDLRDDEDERDEPRLSSVRTPVDTDGIEITSLTDVEFPDVPNDLESIAKLPGRNAALLVESNADGDDPDPSIYVATWDDELNVEIAGAVPWPDTPEPLVNVEATAVAEVGGADRFLYAERAEGSDTTRIHMTDIEVGEDGSVTFGPEWTSVRFTIAQPPEARPASGMVIDGDGTVYVSAAFDPGDLGPFDSAVYEAATLSSEGASGAALTPLRPPVQLGRSNGLKIEALSLVDGQAPVFFGDDDEDYGGLLRQLRVPSAGG